MPVIEVSDLSKKFIIRHEAGKARYSSLREVISNKVRSLVKRNNENQHLPTEEFWALQDINFTIERGDRVGIIGRNGAGKSTLLKILSRIIEPTRGSVRIKGRVASLLEVGTGFHPELTGRENIFLNGAILGMSRTEIRAKFDEIVSFAETERFLDTPVKRYSSGMYVRLAFAVAAHLEPEILLVDEVLSVGDSEFQKKCLGKMEDVSKNEGRTVLFVSHNMGTVAQLCSKAIVLGKGQLKRMGDVSTMISYYLSDGANTENDYRADENDWKAKRNLFTRIFPSNLDGIQTTDFAFNESIRLNFEFLIKEQTAGLQVGIAMQNKFNARVFTVIREIEYMNKLENGKYAGAVILPDSLLAPSVYSFVFALWTKDGRVFELIENVLMIRIYDVGSKLAAYEGNDYGAIIIDPKWV